MIRTEPSPTREHTGAQTGYRLPFAVICSVSQRFPGQVTPYYGEQRRGQTTAVSNTHPLLHPLLFLSKKEKKKERKVVSES